MAERWIGGEVARRARSIAAHLRQIGKLTSIEVVFGTKPHVALKSV